MTYYTLTIDPPITLCERCALVATNTGLGAEINPPFESMAAAALEFSVLMALVGVTADITTSDSGPCGNCERN